MEADERISRARNGLRDFTSKHLDILGLFLRPTILQGTKPQTIAYALTDSPVGLLAWIAEKLLAWTDQYPWTDDESKHSPVSWSARLNANDAVLTWVSLYWLSRAGPASTFRTYYEAMQRPGMGSVFNLVQKEPTIPLGLSFFPRELSRFPKA